MSFTGFGCKASGASSGPSRTSCGCKASTTGARPGCRPGSRWCGHELRLPLGGDDQYLVQLLGYLLDVHAVRPRLVHRPDRRSVHLIGARLHELQALQNVRALGAQDDAQLEVVVLPTVLTLAELLQPVEGLRTNRPLALLDVLAMSDIPNQQVQRRGLCLDRDRPGHLLAS